MERMEFEKAIDEMPEDVLGQIAASMPWSSAMGEDVNVVDEDGFAISSVSNYADFSKLQKMCWEKFLDNPQINSHVRDYMGNLTGYGFSMDSDIPEIATEMKSTIEDPRNALYRNMSKFVARSEIEGELFLCLTVHNDGFVEVDFMSPRSLTASGYKQSGIYYHSEKQNFPLFYEFDLADDSKNPTIIPSINIAYFPELKNYAFKNFKDIKPDYLKSSVNSSRKFSKVGNFKRFIVEWDKGFLTTRNVSHLRTTIIWINHYENLKKWEIDHKKSSGSYLWVASISDAKAFRTWLKMTEDQKKDTGLFAKKKPGGTIVLPPGITLECKNPNLARISDADTDIMGMVISGLNRPEDMVTGATKGSTFSGVNASRGPQADRIQDQIAYFEKFLRYDFWRPIFYLKSIVSDFKITYKVKEVIEFKDKEPVVKNVDKDVHDLIYIEFPVSEVTDLVGKASALLGVKHPSLVETLGIPREDVAKKLGFGNYRKKRLQLATEDEKFPKLLSTVEAESLQQASGEINPPNNTPGKPPNNTPPTDKTDKEQAPKQKQQ